MDILKAINSSSGYISLLQAQALGPANAHIALRNSPIFLLQRRGEVLAWLGLCTGTHPPPTHGLLFVLSCVLQIILEATRMYVNPDRRSACPAVPGGCAHSSQWSQGRGVGDTILPLRRRDSRRHVPSGSQVPHIFPPGGRIRQHVHWGASAARRAEHSSLGTCRGTPAPTRPSAHTHLLAFFTVPLRMVFALV